jgi:hypothetical protein
MDLEIIEDGWDLFRTGSVYKEYKKDNQDESEKLEFYAQQVLDAEEATKPDLTTATGNGLAEIFSGIYTDPSQS